MAGGQVTAPCSCDEAKAWRERALAAEAESRRDRLSLRFARRQMQRLIEQLDAAIFDSDKDRKIDLSRPCDEPPDVVFGSGSVQEMRSLGGLLGYSGGTEEERRAAVEAATKGGS